MKQTSLREAKIESLRDSNGQTGVDGTLTASVHVRLPMRRNTISPASSKILRRSLILGTEKVEIGLGFKERTEEVDERRRWVVKKEPGAF